MIILKNDFYSSFSGAMKSGDTNAIRHLTLNQISDIVAYNEQYLVSLFGKVNVQYPPNPSDKEIVKVLVENLPKNEKLRRGLAFLIADNNDLLKIKSSGSDGKKVNKKAFVDVIDKIYDGYSSVVGEIGTDDGKKNVETQINTEVENKVKTGGINKPNNNKPGDKKSNAIWWIAGIVLLGVGIYVTYRLIKKHKAKKLAMGGSPIQQTPPPAMTPPPIQQTPQPAPMHAHNPPPAPLAQTTPPAPLQQPLPIVA